LFLYIFFTKWCARKLETCYFLCFFCAFSVLFLLFSCAKTALFFICYWNHEVGTEESCATFLCFAPIFWLLPFCYFQYKIYVCKFCYCQKYPDIELYFFKKSIYFFTFFTIKMEPMIKTRPLFSNRKYMVPVVRRCKNGCSS